MYVSRRGFIVGCSAAIAAMSGGRIGNLAFAGPNDSATRDVLVFVFLRGGCDSLNLVAPTSDADYINARPTIRIPSDTAQAGLAIKNPLPGVDFRWHRGAAGLKELYDSDKLAIVHACGLTNGTRSHFDAMDYIERGTPTSKTTSNGWITRHLRSIGFEDTVDTTLPAVSTSGGVPASLLGSSVAVGMSGVNSFDVQGNYRYTNAQQGALRKFYSLDTTPLHASGIATLDTIDTLQAEPPSPDITFPDGTPGDLQNALRTVSQLIRMDVGLQVATIDYGGWDTHEDQGYPFASRVEGLSRGLSAFYNYISAYHNRVTVVVMSEFGRRLKANNTNGTDHGHGGVMMVLGGNVNGGKMYGKWPGLAKEQLDNSVDLAVTTDYRLVLGEILLKRLANPQLGRVFPGLDEQQFQTLNIVQNAATGVLPDFGLGGGKVFLPMMAR